MNFLGLLAIFAVAAVGFFLIVEGIGFLIANTGNRGLSRVQRRLQGEGDVTQVEERMPLARVEQRRAATPVGNYIKGLLHQAHQDIPVYRVYLISGVIAMAIFAVMVLAMPFVPRFLLAIVALVAGSMLPVMYLKSLAGRRMARFEEQFPDALDLVVRSLKIGHPISVAMATIAEEIPDPVGTEFAIAAQQVTYGKSTPEAITELADRVGLQDVRFFAVAVQIHNESGGNLAEILSGLSNVIRSRFQLFRKVKALTVEGRFSAWFLSLFPVVMIFIMSAMQPGYYEKVSDFDYFSELVALTFFLLIVNVLAMRAMTKLKV